MAEIDPIILEIRADLAKSRAEIRTYANDADRQFKRIGGSVQSLEKQMLKSSTAISGSLRGLAGTLGTYFTGRELTGLIDGFTRLQNSLRVAGLEGSRLESVQSSLLDLSTRYGVGIEGLANLYGKATDAGRSFGASEAQVLQLTEATSQALLITGTSAAQAQGAILGLSQALASGTVRAEEYNQINEGGLRPLLQAAAGAERFGGDINKLRAAMLDGKVSSQEFFSSILAGSAQLSSQASKATLTLSGAFEALSSKLTVYIGQSAQVSGATEAIAGAMQLLADNLETIIPLLAVIGTALGVGFVTNAARARVAAIAAAGGMTTLAGAARGALAVLGGPVGIAITALTVGLGYLATQSIDTAKSLSELESDLATAEARLEDARKQAKEAGINIESLSRSTDDAAGSFSEFTSRVWAGVDAMTSASKAARDLTLAKIALSSAEARSTIAELSPQARLQAFTIRTANAGGFKAGPERIAAANETAARLNVAAATLRANEETRKTIEALGDKFKEPESSDRRLSNANADTKKTRTPRAPKDRSEDIAARAAQELASLQIEELRARADLSTSIEERADYERQIISTERQQREADLAARVKAGNLNQEQAAEQQKILDALYGQRITEDGTGDIIVEKQRSVYGQLQARQEQERLARLQAEALRDELDALGAESDITDVRNERVAIERRMLEIQQEIERNLLEEAIARGDVLDAAQARAALDRRQSAERSGFERDNSGPLGRYIDDAKRVGQNLNDAFEGVAVDGLQSLNDGLADAIVNSKSLGDVFKNVAKQIIADLIRIAIQQQIVNALSSALGFGGGGSGGGGFFGSIFGRASGGYVAPGQTVRVNEQRGGAEYLRMGSQGGTVIPLGQANAPAAQPATARQGPIELRVYADRGAFISDVEAISEGQAVKVTMAAAGPLTERAVQTTMGRLNRPRMPGAGR